jgi:hypothetical protein
MELLLTTTKGNLSILNALLNAIFNAILFILALRYYIIFVKESKEMSTLWFSVCKLALICMLSGSFWRLLIDINHIADPNKITLTVIAALARNFGSGIIIWDLMQRLVKK